MNPPGAVGKLAIRMNQCRCSRIVFYCFQKKPIQNGSMKKKIVEVGLPLFVTSVLALAVFSSFGKPSAAQQKLVESVKQGEFVFEQYFTADYVTAKDAMLNHIRLLDRLSTESGDSIRDPYAVDAMSWYVRLAKLDERNSGNEKRQYIQEACSRCERFGWADCSEAKLRLEVDQLDTIALARLRKR